MIRRSANGLVVFLLAVTAGITITTGVVSEQSITQSSLYKKEYTACYVCKDETYVRYIGKDSYFMRREALEQFACRVVGEIPTCTTERVVKATNLKYFQKNYQKKK